MMIVTVLADVVLWAVAITALVAVAREGFR